MHNILALNDRAIAAFLVSEGVTVPVYPFKRSLGKALPCVIVHSRKGNPIAPFGAVVEIECDIIVRSEACVDYGAQDSDPITQNDSLMSSVMAAMHKFGDGEQSGGDLADAITDAARAADVDTYTCESVGIQSIEASVESGGDSSAWTDVITMMIAACPSNVS